jgi:hypothetical protein
MVTDCINILPSFQKTNWTHEVLLGMQCFSLAYIWRFVFYCVYFVYIVRNYIIMENVSFSRLCACYLRQDISLLCFTLFLWNSMTILEYSVGNSVKKCKFLLSFSGQNMLISIMLTWSKYFCCTRCLAEHIWQGCSPFVGNSSWFTTMLCVSIPHFVSSCTNLSVSYSDRNSAIHTHTNVVCSCKAKNFLLVYSSFCCNSNASHC